MRWTNLLFAHWPVAANQMTRLLPEGFAVDTYDGTAWARVVPFRMEGVQLRGLPEIPGTSFFAEANLRTYVHDRKSGQHGVYFFSLDASNPLAVIAARTWYQLPYYFASMHMQRGNNTPAAWWRYTSKRLFSSTPASLRVRYRGAGVENRFPQSKPGTIEHFLTERYALFTGAKQGRLMRADVHHLPWTLEPAEAEFEELTLPAAHSIVLPTARPLLHFSKKLEVFAWPPKAIA